MNERSVYWWVWSLLVVVFLAPSGARGAGFAVREQSAKELGSAFAGGAAAAEDAATIFFNPAGMSRLPGSQLVAGGHLILPSADFRNGGSTHVTGAPLTGGEGGNGTNSIATANLYVSHQLTDRLHLGLGLFSPFGLSTEYESTWVGRYHSVKSDLLTLNINPCASYRVNDSLSLGFGLNAQYAHASLSSAVDFGTIFFGLPGFAPQRNDGFVTLKGDSWEWGYNVGILYELTRGTRVGMSYRSDIDHTIEGSAHFSGVPAVNPTGRFVDTAAKAALTMPDSASFSVWHNFTEEVAATADFTWTHWGSFNELRATFANPRESDLVITTRWENTWRYALGLVYTPGPWTLRTGVAYDESPVTDAALRTPRIPDNDRIWATVGAGYRISDRVSFDVAYAHLFVRDPTIDKSATGEDALRGALRGSYRAEVDIVGLQVAWGF